MRQTAAAAADATVGYLIARLSHDSRDVTSNPTHVRTSGTAVALYIEKKSLIRRIPVADKRQ